MNQFPSKLKNTLLYGYGYCFSPNTSKASHGEGHTSVRPIRLKVASIGG